MSSPRPAQSITGDLKPPTVDDYIDEGEIARGSQGEVRSVMDTNLLRRLAMKLLDPSLSRVEVNRKRFVEEAQITSQLDHPNIPPVHRIGMDGDGRLYFTMKMLQGSTLEDLLATGEHHQDWEKLFSVLQTFVTVCNAVAFANARGVVHRDLKPENIMVAEHGQVYVVDWGIARIIGLTRPSGQDGRPPVRVWGQATNESNTIAGTPEYMAPEQAEGRIEAIDGRTDVFALGAILYRICVGHPPYQGETVLQVAMRAAMVDYVHPMVASPHRVPEQLCEIITRAMSRDPANRYQTVEALSADVSSFMRDPARLPIRRFAAGSTIIREGDAADCAYVITRGTVRIYKTVGGRRVILRELGPGSAFGEAAIFSAEPRSASVEALEPLTALVVTREALEQELGQSTILAPLVRNLAARFRDVDRELTAQRAQTSGSAISRAAILYAATHGMPLSPTTRIVPWSQLCGHLCAVFSCDAELVTASVRSIPEVELDIPSDVLRVIMNHYV
ncbi:MAG: protein kinase domain-containing protein [Polyangiaceae bacterium]|jgi:eukaryotic-like serine/threonine-protein kinase